MRVIYAIVHVHTLHLITLPHAQILLCNNQSISQ